MLGVSIVLDLAPGPAQALAIEQALAKVTVLEVAQVLALLLALTLAPPQGLVRH